MVFPIVHVSLKDIPVDQPFADRDAQILAWQEVVYLFREETLEILIGEKPVFSDVRLHFLLIEGKSLRIIVKDVEETVTSSNRQYSIHDDIQTVRCRRRAKRRKGFNNGNGGKLYGLDNETSVNSHKLVSDALLSVVNIQINVFIERNVEIPMLINKIGAHAVAEFQMHYVIYLRRFTYVVISNNHIRFDHARFMIEGHHYIVRAN